ncbi:MAG TPA: hypothetical protein VIS10_13770 [Anaerolineales bacterium]
MSYGVPYQWGSWSALIDADLHLVPDHDGRYFNDQLEKGYATGDIFSNGDKLLALTWATQNDLCCKSVQMERRSCTPKRKRHAPNEFFGHETVQNILFFRHDTSGEHPETSKGHSFIEPETAMRGTGECSSPNLL